MSDFNGNVVVAGESIYAGIDETDISEIPLAIVIEFKDRSSLKKAMEEQKVEFTIFETS